MNTKEYIYLCGPTVYNKVHIGNMRPIVTFDLMLRAIKYLKPNIKLIHNITDIDDKIINRAKEENISEEEIAQKYTQFYLDMLKAYNIKTIDYLPKVSEKIPFIESFINELIKKNYVYESNGSYYFKTEKLDTYGEVSNNTLSNLQSEELNLEKENSCDFALWKNKTEGKTWNTKSLGVGRPGWHTECAAFVYELTKGRPLLIHGGGIDLKFPHHENENAQFRALTNLPICNEWIHIGIINYKNQKMSKSLGNIVFADQFLEQYQNQTNASNLFRLIILSSSIQSTIELNDELVNSLIKKNNQIQKIINYALLNNLDHIVLDINPDIIDDLANGKFSNVYKTLNELIKNFNSSKDEKYASMIFNIIKFLGFDVTNKNINDKTKLIYVQWKIESSKKNFEKADQLRKVLIDKNLI